MRTSRPASARALVLGVFLATAACSWPARETARAREGSASEAEPNLVVGTQPRARRMDLSDDEIRQAVIERLFRGPHGRAGALIVGCEKGIIELTGTVDNLLAKDRAVAIAERVKGVRAVVDGIDVEPRVRVDEDLTRDVANALRYDPAASSYPVAVSAAGGVVRLTGTVHSWQERGLAERLVRGVSGVKAVQNDLTVEVLVNRSDAEMKREIESRLRWNTFVNDGMIKVAVSSGNAKLTGAVGSAAERTAAHVLASVRGLRSVDVSELEIEWWARSDALRNWKFARKTDAQIATAVRAAMAYDPRLSAFDLDAVVKGGRVRLSGRVPSMKSRLAAESIARQIVEVSAVINELEIVAREPISDSELEIRLKSALSSSSVLAASDILTEVADGYVTLTGRVPTRFESAEAADVASNLEGVRGVANRLTVSAPELAFVWVPGVFPYGPYIEGWRSVAVKPAQSDRELARSVARQLEWTPFLDATRIRVEVRAGKVFLGGSVDDSRQRRTAEESALEAGAIAVENQLELG